MEFEGGKLLVQRTPIARLPVELLTNIIDISAHDPLYGGWDQYLPDVSITISHVCRFWRDAALGPGGKMLWTRVPLRHSAACVRAFMERSNPLLVFLKIELGDTSVPTSLTALAEAVTFMDRVGGISFNSLYDRDEDLNDVDDQLHRDIYNILSSKPAPSLEIMSWCYAHTLEEAGPTTLPLNLFAGQVPDNLCFLRITGMELPFDHTILRANLTSLELEDCSAWETVDDLLGTLSRIPALEQISFKAMSQHLVEGDHQLSQAYAQRSISLPRLDTLILTDSQPDLPGIILFYLRLAIDTRIHIEIELDEDTIPDEDVSILRGALEAHYSDFADGQKFAFSAVSVGLCGANEYGLSMQASSHGETYLSVVLAPAWPTNTSGNEMMMKAARQLLSISIMSTATRLNISHSNFFAIGRAADWLALRTCVPNLETIAISRDALYGLCPALLAPPDIESGVLFPKLGRIRFEGIAFDEDANLVAFFIVALVFIARHRLRHGHPIKRIKIRRCFGAKKLSEHLSAALPDTDVVWREVGTQGKALVKTEATRWDHGDADLREVD
ncbi:hypothetical protein PENSPDRAFT_750189 [Peniophora sp. CONT]|nr:hypothetical protein PENSPDRAFT_750189 [Peniophora sp. CONT]